MPVGPKTPQFAHLPVRSNDLDRRDPRDPPSMPDVPAAAGDESRDYVAVFNEGNHAGHFFEPRLLVNWSRTVHRSFHGRTPAHPPRKPARPPWRTSNNAFKTWRRSSSSMRENRAPTPGHNRSCHSQFAGRRRDEPRRGNFLGWNKGFFLQSPDQSCQLRITGQIQSDFRGFLTPVDTSTTANQNVAGTPVTGSPDTFLIRRARLGIEATMANYYEFRLLPDFAGTSVSKSITDAYMNVHYWDAIAIRDGQVQATVQLRRPDPGPLRADHGTLDDGSTGAATGRRGHDPLP